MNRRTDCPRRAVIYKTGAVRAFRWRGSGDVRGHQPEPGWTAQADLTEIQPFTGRALPSSQWWIIETKN